MAVATATHREGTWFYELDRISPFCKDCNTERNVSAATIRCMKGSLLTVLAVLMGGMIIGIVYLASTRAEAATAQECAVLQGANPSIVCNADTVVTGIDASLGITASVAQAKAYLKSIAQDLRNSAAPPTDPSNIDRLNNAFAVCAAQFLRAYESTYGKGSVVVVSAYRDGPSGANARAGGAPSSNHTRGVAMDVNPKGRGSYETLWSFAQKNPSFGVCFPHLGRDRPHMILAGIGGSESAKCAAQGVTQKCSGSPEYDSNPDRYTSYTPNEGDTTPGPSSQDTESLLDSLSGGSGSGSGPGGSSGAFTPAFGEDAYTSSFGFGDGNSFALDDDSAYERLLELGEFGELGEGEEVQGVINEGNSQNSGTTSSSTSTSSQVNSGITADCVGGVTTHNIYGNLICVRNSVQTVIESASSPKEVTGNAFVDSIVESNSVTRAITSFANQIIPLRHLVNGSGGGSASQYLLGSGDKLAAYDAYQPGSYLAAGLNDRLPITEEDFIAWLVRQDLVEDDPATTATLSAALGLFRPALFHVMILLFGTGSYAFSALFEIASTI